MIYKPEIGVSVCMATCNGQEYVAEPIGSIVQQISPEDELVAVGDACTDGTADVVRGRCTMAFRAASMKLVLPFPVFLAETRDQWLALVANLRRDMIHVGVPTVASRLHAENTAPKKIRPRTAVLPARIMLVQTIVGRHYTKAG